MIEFVHRIVESAVFRNTVLVLIVIGAVIVGLETSPALVERYGTLLYTLDRMIVTAFAIEAILKMAKHGRHWYRYFREPWNVFDFVIVVVCLLPSTGTFAAVLRLARVLRTLRMVTAVPRLQLLVGSLLKSIPSMGYIGLLLSMLFYIYAVLGVFLFRGNDPGHFGDLPTAFLTLFRVVTLEDWTDVMYAQMLGSDQFASQLSGVGPMPRAMPIVGAAYFVSFVLLGTMIMLNLFIGVIINSMNEAHDEQEMRLRQKHIDKLGYATLDDDIAAIERDLGELTKRLHRLRKRPDAARGVAAETEAFAGDSKDARRPSEVTA
ncbi:MAG: ion transporter [Phycisphaerae bacterium]